jgi:hypothetical protein
VPESDIPAEPVEAPSPSACPCRHLRSKGMYVYTDGIAGEPGEDDVDNSIYWCLKTMTSFGPDDEFVDRRECRMPGRSCYEPL